MTNFVPATYLKGGIEPSFCIGEAWELVKRRPWFYIGAGLVTAIIGAMIPFVSVFLLGPMMGGFAYIVLRDIRNQHVNFGMLFKGFEKFLKLMVFGLIQALPGFVLQGVQLAFQVNDLFRTPSPGDGTFFQEDLLADGFANGFTAPLVILMIGYWFFTVIWNSVMIFAIPLIIEFDAGVLEAITLGFGALFSNVGGMIVLFIYGILISLLGMIALCVGIFVAIPVIYAGNVIAYRLIFSSPYGDEFARGGGINSSIFGLND